jgi:hypothetical protein
MNGDGKVRKLTRAGRPSRPGREAAVRGQGVDRVLGLGLLRDLETPPSRAGHPPAACGPLDRYCAPTWLR